MSFSDVIKKSVLEGFNTGDLHTTTIVVTLGVAILLGLFVYFVYRVTAKTSFYNRDFNKSLATLPVITAGIMLAMQSNLVISLGMVGALSIVRFRNAVKSSADLTYLFWSISIGIVVGAGLFKLAVLLSLCISALIVGLDMLPAFHSPVLLVVSGSAGMREAELMACVKEFCPKFKIRSRYVTQKGTEWILEVRIKDEAALVQRVAAVNGVLSLNLLSHDGEVRF